MQKTSASPNRRTAHSAGIVHSALCIALVVFAANADIPATLEKNTDYVVDGETGAGPSKIVKDGNTLYCQIKHEVGTVLSLR
jgi:hypothetical protein